MNTPLSQSTAPNKTPFHYTKIKPTRKTPTMAEDVLNGLTREPRSLPSKYLYDATGSKLFEQICVTPEYYPTRVEDLLLNRHSLSIIDEVQPNQILEFGSGDAKKTRHLFDACKQSGKICDYAPFEYCDKMLQEATARLAEEYDWLKIYPLLGDYNAGLDNIPKYEGPRLFLFLGSTIGNFSV